MFPKSFQLVKDKFITEINTHVYLLVHKKTKAEVLYLKNDDTNKMFGIAFKTPTTDKTGVDHILEHCVLMGSEKYPVKAPFFEVSKTALSTFMNAMTYSDKTFYPVASQNAKSFQNLMDLYLDAVFNPLLKEENFRSDGWRYEFDDTGKIKYSGVVFNEMKGATYDEESVIWRSIEEELYPDTTYGTAHGGFPEYIPDLTHKELVSFHERYYHPSNSRTVLYGDLDISAALEHLESYFSKFDYSDINPEIPLQKPFSVVKKKEVFFGVNEKKPDDGVFVKGWAFNEGLGFETKLGISLLDYIVCISEASPLKSKILELGIGTSMVQGGLNDHMRQPGFVTGIRGVKEENFSAASKIVNEVLTDLSKGIPKENIEAALNRVEFFLREGNTSQTGLTYANDALAEWLYGRDPVEALAFEEPLLRIKQRIDSGEKYLENLLQEYFIKNTHSAELELKPDTQLSQKAKEKEDAKLSKFQASLTPSQLSELKMEAENFKKWQETPDTPEDLAKLPQLELSDIEKQTRKINSEIVSENDYKVQINKLDTNGIVYLNLSFDIGGIEEKLIPYIGFYILCLTKMGTLDRTHTELSLLLGKTCGGFSGGWSLYNHAKTLEPIFNFTIKTKSTEERFADTLTIIQEIIARPDFRDSNVKRLKEILEEEKKGFERDVIQSGVGLAATRAGSHVDYVSNVQDRVSGFGYYLFIKDLLSGFDSNAAEIMENLRKLHSAVINRQTLTVNLGIDKNTKNREMLIEEIQNLAAGLPSYAPHTKELNFTPRVVTEAFVTSASVNYIGAVGLLLGIESDGAHLALQSIIRSDYLLEEIRVKGGAYGFGCSINSRKRIMKLISSRDPNMERTLNVFTGVGDFLRKREFSAKEIENRVIGAFSGLDDNMTASALNSLALTWHVTGFSEDLRQKVRDELFAFPHNYKEKIVEFAKLLEEFRPSRVVLGGPKIKTSSIKFDTIHEL